MAEGLDREAWTSSSTSQDKSIPETPPKLWPGVPFDSPRSSAVSPVHNPAYHEAEDSNADSFLIVSVAGTPLNYRIPSFPVVVVKLRHMCFEVEGENDNVVKYDGFIKDSDSLDCKVPGVVVVTESCYVDAGEFGQVAYVRHLNFPTPGFVYVVWKWEWVDDSPALSPVCPSPPPHNSSPTESGDETYPADELQHHVVKFKCIGANKDQTALEVLKMLAQLSNGELRKIDVKLVPEPKNPFDAKAIAFVTFCDGKWHRIGYVVREALDEVHSAMNDKKIVDVCFESVKYRINWVLSGPGYYAAINVAKQGKWSPTVCKSASPQ